MWNSEGRSGHHEQYVGSHYTDWSGISPNGRQYKSSVTGQTVNLEGQAYWSLRKQLPNKLDSASEIRWDSYKTPAFYHSPRKQKPVVESPKEKQENISQETLDTDNPIPHNTQQEEKESIFLTLKDGNVFKQMYIKYMKWKEK